MSVGSVSGAGQNWQVAQQEKAADQRTIAQAVGTLAEDTVNLSAEGQAMAMGDPDWPDPPAEDTKG